MAKDDRDKIYEAAYKLYENEEYFSALDKIATQYKYKTPDQNVQHFLEKLVKHTGSYYFNNYKDIELRRMNIPTTDLIMAKRNMYLKKYSYALKRLKSIPKGHRIFPESLLVKGDVYSMSGKYKQAEEQWAACANIAESWEKNTESKIARYFAIIKESCIINSARIKYKQALFQEAIRLYENIPKTSFNWPYILLEKAWAYYYLGNYNRSLGILITYNSPLLKSYFKPEAEVLKALNYFSLCLFDDAQKVVNNYYSVYAPKSKKLKKILTQNSKTVLYFFNLMFSPLSESEKSNEFIRNLITQVSKRTKYSLDLKTLYAINREIYNTSDKKKYVKLLKTQNDLKEQINHYVKVSMYRFINEIHKLSSEMFNIKLEILSRKRALAYKNKNIINKQKRGNFKNVDRKSYQEFWTFNNAFWADELGDYSFGLTSQCINLKS